MDVEEEKRHILAVEEDETSVSIKYAKVADEEETVESNEYSEEEEDEKRFNSEETSYRSIDLARAEYIDEDKRTVRIALSSEEPVERSFGIEILDHSRESVDMEWARSGNMPVLLDHDSRSLVGIVESFELDSASNRTLAHIRFGRSELAQEAWQDVLDGIRKSVSVGYRINSMVRDESAEDATFRANWTPMEASLVSIPADTNPMVGVARSKDSAEVNTPVINNNNLKEIKMTEEIKSEVNLDEVRSEATVVARSAVAKEAKEILALATKHNKRDLADASIGEGHTLEQFRGILLNNISDDTPLETPVAEVGLNEKQRGQYSFLNAIRAASSGDWSKAGLEREISNEIASRSGKEARGFYLPMDIGWGQRDQTVGTDSQGGFLKGTDHLGNEFIGEVYANSVVASLGGRVMTGLQGDIAIPKLSASVTNTAFVAEGSAPSEGAGVFAQVTMAPKTLATYVDYTRKLALQSDPSVEQILRNDIVQTMAAKIDQVALNGGESNEPSGILQESDTNVVAIATNGGAVTYAKVVDMEAAIASDNALTGTLNFATTPGVQGAMRQIPRQGSGVEDNFILNDSNSILGHNVTVSTNVPSNLTKGSTSGTCHALILGDFSQVMMGFWSGVDVVVDSSTLSTSGGTRIAFFQDVDVAVRIPNAFAAIKDITV
jgi:HK97 family phage major capsid protein